MRWKDCQINTESVMGISVKTNFVNNNCKVRFFISARRCAKILFLNFEKTKNLLFLYIYVYFFRKMLT